MVSKIKKKYLEIDFCKKDMIGIYTMIGLGDGKNEQEIIEKAVDEYLQNYKRN